jgi:hypothetical protein
MSSQGNVIPEGYNLGKLQSFTPEQQSLFTRLLSQTKPGSFLGRLSQGDEGLFSQMEHPALSQFSQLQGQLASRFSRGGGAGSLGTRHSSGFYNTQSQAASDFAQQLQSNRMNLQRQALQDLLGLSQNLLGQRPYDQFLAPEREQQDKSSTFHNILSGVLPFAGAAIGSYFGMPEQGAALGSAAGQAFL